MTNTTQLRKVLVNLDGAAARFFVEDNFRAARICEGDMPVFSYHVTHLVTRSISYAVFNADKTPAHMPETNRWIKYYMLQARNYILVEKGRSGYDVDYLLFDVQMAKEADGYTVSVSENTDNAVKSELVAHVVKSSPPCIYNMLHERVSTHVFEITKSGKKMLNLHECEKAKKYLSLISETCFLDQDPAETDIRYYPIDLLKDSHSYFVSEYEHDRTIKELLKPRKLYTCKDKLIDCSNSLDEFGPDEVRAKSVVLLEDLGDKPDWEDFTEKNPLEKKGAFIVQSEDIVHNYDGVLFMKVRVTHRWPQDRIAIKTDHPEFFRKLEPEVDTMKHRTPLKEAPAESYKLGDRKIYLPAVRMEKYKGMEKGIFQFVISGQIGIRTPLFADFGPNLGLIHADSGLPVAVVEHDGVRYIAVYNSANGLFRFRKKLYGKFTFAAFVSVQDLFDKDDSVHENFRDSLRHAYMYLSYHGKINPTKIDDETFDVLGDMEWEADSD